ncbi:hypothetical protein NKH89_35150 [Mesorhizobium sp. M0923]|uniref:hypothetical protein n=1 Tax=Mesorhizobium sp. M0923 TaxID=2957028 RepID=UPI0033370630
MTDLGAEWTYPASPISTLRTARLNSRSGIFSGQITPDRFRRWGASIGPQTEGLITAILASRPHPEQSFRTCLGILRPYRDISRERAETVSARAVEIGGLTCKTIASLVYTQKRAGQSTERAAVMEHANLRGPGYFH